MASAESARLVMMVVAMVKSREEKEEESSVASARAPACREISPSCVGACMWMQIQVTMCMDRHMHTYII